MLYVIYWPQKTTWTDDAESSVRRNRITFMRCCLQVPIYYITSLITSRYLTKISHQTMVLVAPEHASQIVWKTEDNADDMNVDDDDDEADRMFSFEVSKTKEQDEGVSAKPGFNVRSEHVADNAFLISQQLSYPAVRHVPSLHDSIDPNLLRPRLIHGDTSVGFATVQYIPPVNETRRLTEDMNSVQLRSSMYADPVLILCSTKC
jgi:hypothetical protein